MWVQCCVCKKVRKGAKWRRIEIPQEDRSCVSHGYCPSCANLAFREAREEKSRRQQQAARV